MPSILDRSTAGGSPNPAKTRAARGAARRRRQAALLGVAIAVPVLLAGTSLLVGPSTTQAQACPPRCGTPVITPAWHIHMCDEPYPDQADDQHCMNGDGVTEFPSGLDRVYIIYCHRGEDLVVVQVKDAAGGLQYVNHPDGITYYGDACESLEFARRNGIPSAGSPYYTSAYWPEGPFIGVSRGIEWYIGLFVAFDQDNYYGRDAEAVISARDPAANLDPTALEEIVVHVTSTSDPVGIDVILREEAPGFPVFRTTRPLRFAADVSDPAGGTIKVARNDTLTVKYCPRNCTTPYVDTATWYDFVGTITPTPLPTWGGPSPTPTYTPPPDLKVEYITLRPDPDDVGYVPQISANRNLPNHLGYPTIYSGMWTRGRNRHFGMVQFDLRSLPEGATVLDGRLELVGRDKDFTDPGVWTVNILGTPIDTSWRQATFDQVQGAAVLARLGGELAESDLGRDHINSLGMDAEALAAINGRLASTRRVSIRIDGPVPDEDNLFGWFSGVDKYHREPDPPDPALRPALVLGYSLPGAFPSPTGTVASSTATPQPTPDGGASRTPSTTPPPSATPAPSHTPTARLVETAAASVTASRTASASVTPLASVSASPSVTPLSSVTAHASAVPTPVPTQPTPVTPGAPTGRQVCVSAFDDRDADGQRGPAERFLPGVTIRLTHVATGAFVTWTTDGLNDPDYCWSGLADGDYDLAIVQAPPGHVAPPVSRRTFVVPLAEPSVTYAFALPRIATPAPSAAPGTPHPTGTRERSPTPGSTPTPTPTRTVSPTPTPQPTVSGPSGEICAAVYADRDGDGFRANGEPYLAEVVIRILDRDRAPVREMRSLAAGVVCSRVAASVYHVTCDLAPGMLATTTRDKAVLLTDLQRQIVEFGQRQARDRAFVPLALRPSPR